MVWTASENLWFLYFAGKQRQDQSVMIKQTQDILTNILKAEVPLSSREY